MGILTDFFVTGPDRAALLAFTSLDGSGVPMFEAKSIDPVKVSTLFRIASNGRADLATVHDRVDVDRREGPWLVVIRDEVTEVIAGIADDEIAQVADAWAATQEWRLDHAEPGVLSPVLRQLRDLARQAAPPAERLYLRISL